MDGVDEPQTAGTMSTWFWIWFAGAVVVQGVISFWTHVLADDSGHVGRLVGLLMWALFVLPVMLAAWFTAPWNR